MNHHVLLAHAFYRVPGGEDQYVRQQKELLLEQGASVSTFYRRNDDVDNSPRSMFRMIQNSPLREDLTALIRSQSPDVIHLHNPYPALGPAVHQAARETRTPLVQTLHNFRLRCPNAYMFTEGELCRRCEGGGYHNAVVHRCFPTKRQSVSYAGSLWIHRFVLRTDEALAGLIAPSRFLGDMAERWGFPPERVDVVRNFSNIPPSSGSLGEHGIYVGRLSPEKGLTTLLAALREAGDPPFTIVGGGPLEEDLKALALSLGLSGPRFLGHLSRDRVVEELRRCRFICFPSTWDENAPLAALEAMLLGRPLLTTNRGGLPELAAEGRGVVVPAGDPAALGVAIRHFHEDAAGARAMGERALEFAVGECTPQVHAERLARVYDKATDRRPLTG